MALIIASYSAADHGTLYVHYLLAINQESALTLRPMMPRPPLVIVKLSDNFRQYSLILKCACGHTRPASPATLAALAGWDARLDDVVKRLRCSRCGKRECSATVTRETKRDG